MTLALNLSWARLGLKCIRVANVRDTHLWCVSCQGEIYDLCPSQGLEALQIQGRQKRSETASSVISPVRELQSNKK